MTHTNPQQTDGQTGRETQPDRQTQRETHSLPDMFVQTVTHTHTLGMGGTGTTVLQYDKVFRNTEGTIQYRREYRRSFY